MTRTIFVLLFIGHSLATYPQRIATFEVELPAGSSGLDVPVGIALDRITYLADSSLSLVEVQGAKRIATPLQISQGDQRILHWIVKNRNEKLRKIVFELTKGSPGKSNLILTDANEKSLTIKSGAKNLLRYNHAILYPPAGVDTAYKRSGFIHPLWSPRGQELTRIQPPDHYHHYGIWNPWTHVLYKGDTVDFWNIADRKGTVRFSKFVSITDGPVFSELQAVHEHVVTPKNGKEEVALNELQTIRVYRPEPNQDYYLVDLTFQLNCATQNQVKLLEYRYGGFGWRTTSQWDKDNSNVITSEGKNRKEADGSKARWCIVQGAVDGDHAGVVMMSYPTNYNHPEPLRIWPENQYDRGDMFANFSPTKDKDWVLLPGNNYVLKYRLIVFNGQFTREQADVAWNAYASQPKIVIK